MTWFRPQREVNGVPKWHSDGSSWWNEPEKTIIKGFKLVANTIFRKKGSDQPACTLWADRRGLCMSYSCIPPLLQPPNVSTRLPSRFPVLKSLPAADCPLQCRWSAISLVKTRNLGPGGPCLDYLPPSFVSDAFPSNNFEHREQKAARVRQA